MRKKSIHHQMDGLVALLLLGVFAACVLAVLLTGAGVYQRLTERDQAAARLELRQEGDVWLADGNWESGGAYRLTAQAVDSGVPGLEAVRVAVEDSGGAVLFAVDVTWQGEVDSRG